MPEPTTDSIYTASEKLEAEIERLLQEFTDKYQVDVYLVSLDTGYSHPQPYDVTVQFSTRHHAR